MIAFERRASAVLYNLLRALGDQRPFLMPANICPIVPETFMAAEQPFELVDIAEPSLEIDAAVCLEHLRTGAFAGVLFVRPYGTERDPSSFFAQLREVQHDLLIIDDKCLCRPDCDGTSLSPLADVTLFSTGRVKYTDLGEGGFAHLSERVSYQRASAGPDWLDPEPPQSTWEDYRSRTLEAMEAATAHKRVLNAIYTKGIPHSVQLPADFQQWRFNIRVPDAEKLVAELFDHDLFASRHYPPLGYYSVAARLYADIVNLFNDRYFTEEQALRATELVMKHLQ